MKPCHSHRALQHAAIVVQPEPIYIRTRLTRVRRVHMQFGAFTVAIVHLSLASPYHALRPRWKNDHGSCTQPLLRKPARDHREPASTLLSPVGRFVSRAAWPRTGRCIVWLHVRCCWARRRLVVLQPDLQTFANLNQALARCILSTSVGAVPAVLSTSCVRPKTASVTALVTHGK